MPKKTLAPLALVLAALLAASSVSVGAEDLCHEDVLWTIAPLQDMGIQLENAFGSIAVELGGPGSDLQVRGASPEIAVHVEEEPGGWQLNVKRETSDKGSVRSECGAIILRVPAGSALDLSLITDGGDILIPEFPGRVEARSNTGPITLYLDPEASVTVDLATSGEITVDFSVLIEYVYHHEPAKLGKVVIGDGLTSARVNSRRGHISVLRRIP